MTKKQNESTGTFGGRVGEGIGCLFIAIAIVVIFNAPAVIALIANMITCHK